MPAQRRPSNEIEAELQDPENWDREHAVVGEPVEFPVITYSVRLDLQTARILGDAARKHDMPVSRYLLHAALETARRDLGWAALISRSSRSLPAWSSAASRSP